MDIEYQINVKPTVDDFVGLLERSTLAERRPVDDLVCIKGMLDNSNLIVTAWHNGDLVGIARSMTDYHYACYLSDLAVDLKYQRQNIGRNLQSHTQSQLGPKCKLILISAPAANEYYGHIGFTKNERCWVLQRNQQVID